MSWRPRSLLQIHVAVFLFALPGPLGKLLLTESLTPQAITFWRVAIAAPVLLFAARQRHLPLRVQARTDLFAFAGFGTLLALHWTTFFLSVQDAGVAVALLTYSTFPVFVVLLEPIFFGERFRVRDLGLALLVLLGVVVLRSDYHLSDRVTQGVLWGVASGLTFALLSLLNRGFVRRYSGILIAFYQDAFAALALLPFVPSLALPNAWAVLLVLVLGVLCTALAHALFIAGLGGVSARTASMIACLEPVYGTALAAWLVRESIPARTIAGGLIILAVAVHVTLCARSEKTDSSGGKELVQPHGGRRGVSAPVCDSDIDGLTPRRSP